MSILSVNQLLPLILASPLRANCCYLRHVSPLNARTNRNKAFKISAQSDDSPKPTTSQQQVSLSVLRFTFGIPWLDESYLPRWIGCGFGSLIVLNHFVGSNSPVTSPQLISEALGLVLAAFSVSLPYVGKFLKGSISEELTTLPRRAQQIFAMSQSVSDTLKEDLAWTTYILLRNTKSISVLISLQDVICVRGYWSLPENLSKDDILYWCKAQIQKFGLSNVKDTFYYSQTTGSILEEVVPDGTSSILIQPVFCTSSEGNENVAGFVLLASNVSYAYGEKDKLWIQAIANKIRDLAKI